MFKLILVPVRYKLTALIQVLFFSEIMMSCFSLQIYEDVSNEPTVPNQPRAEEARILFQLFQVSVSLSWALVCAAASKVYVNTHFKCAYLCLPGAQWGRRLSCILPWLCPHSWDLWLLLHKSPVPVSVRIVLANQLGASVHLAPQNTQRYKMFVFSLGHRCNKKINSH